MQLLICPDGFKHSLTATQAAETIASFLNSKTPQHRVLVRPLADGGEGFVESFAKATNGKKISRPVKGPMGGTVQASYLMPDDDTAIIEMAQASGLMLTKHNNPELATTYGTGELICDALKQGAGKIIIGLGGSATNDAGAGMAQALGYRLLDKDGRSLPPGGVHLSKLHHISTEKVMPEVYQTTFIAACDVTNPLTGPQGASAIYGPQKGASEKQVQALDESLSAFHDYVLQHHNINLNTIPGSGAAGGMGAGIHYFLNGSLVSGFDVLNSVMKLDKLIESSDLIITGEGSLDQQTLNGKLVQKVCQLAKEKGKPVIAFAGKISLDQQELQQLGLKAAIAITPKGTSDEKAFAEARLFLEKALAENVHLFSSLSL